jgi:hypothetical protein
MTVALRLAILPPLVSRRGGADFDLGKGCSILGYCLIFSMALEKQPGGRRRTGQPHMFDIGPKASESARNGSRSWCSERWFEISA